MTLLNQYKHLLSLKKRSNAPELKSTTALDHYTLISRGLLTLLSLSLSLMICACDDDSTEGSEDPSPMVRAGDTAGDTAGDAAGDAAGMSAGDTAGMSAGDAAGTTSIPQGTDGYLARLTIDSEARDVFKESL